MTFVFLQNPYPFPFAILHALAAFLLLLLTGTVVPVNCDFRQTPDGVPVFVVSNGVHTDIVVPLRDTLTGFSWLQQLSQPAWSRQFAPYQFVGFGWGDEGFYLHSYGGHSPGVGTTLKAVLLPTPTLLHVDFYRAAPLAGRRVVPLRISAEQYHRLTTAILRSFARDSTGHLIPLAAPGYTSDDFFLRARGRYHALHTCNDWTNRSLQRAGVRAALKAPLAGSVLFQVRRAAR